MAKVRISSTPILGTLVDQTALIGTLSIASDNEYRALSMNMTYSVRENTAGEGPIHVGLCHGDYTAAEVEQWFESTASISRGDLIANEQANRRCRQVGTFNGLASEESLNDGKPIRTKLNWVIPEGKTLNAWLYNDSGANLSGGAKVPIMGDLIIRYI